MIRRRIVDRELERLARKLAEPAAQERMRVFDDLAAAPVPPEPRKVIVVGAGLAGLCAAYELEQRGQEVVLLEADPEHVGGRVRTKRFGGSLYGELGAMRIPEAHLVTRKYAADFGLTLRRFVQSNDAAFRYVRGLRVRIADEENLKARFALAPGERPMKVGDIWNRAVTDLLKQLSPEALADLTADELATPEVRALDQRTLRQQLEAAGFSREAIEFLSSVWGVETSLPSATTEHLREQVKEVWDLEFDEIVGGTDLLPAAFARELREKPRLGCEVVRVELTRGSQVRAIFRCNGGMQEATGDYLLCTVPLPVLQRIDFEPELSAPKRRAIRQVTYDSSTKVLAVAERRFWETDDGIHGGGSSTDLPIGFVYYPSDNATPAPVPQALDPEKSNGPGVLLASYTWGQPARRLGLLPPDEAKQVVLRYLARVHPQLAKDPGLLPPENMTVWSWDEHPWSGGAFAWYFPGEHTALHRDVGSAEGRIHFAGEHTSFDHTWMQGALESGVRAVTGILRHAAENPAGTDPSA